MAAHRAPGQHLLDYCSCILFMAIFRQKAFRIRKCLIGSLMIILRSNLLILIVAYKQSICFELKSRFGYAFFSVSMVTMRKTV